MINNKRKNLSNEEKHEVLDLLAKNEKRELISQQYGICNATISNIKYHEDEIRADCMKREKKRNREGKYVEMENYLADWFFDQRRLNVPVNGPILMAKSVEFASMCRDASCKDFKPSNGWLGRFKKRNNISWPKFCGEKGSVDVELLNNCANNQLLSDAEIIQQRRNKIIHTNETLKENKNLNQKSIIDNDEIDEVIETNKELELELRVNEIETREKEDSEKLNKKIEDFKEGNENDKKRISDEKADLMNQAKDLVKKISILTEANENMNSDKLKMHSEVEKLKRHYNDKLESYKKTNSDYCLFKEKLILFGKYLEILTERQNKLKKIFSFLGECFEKFDNLNDINSYFEENKIYLREFSDFLSINLEVAE